MKKTGLVKRLAVLTMIGAMTAASATVAFADEMPANMHVEACSETATISGGAYIRENPSAESTIVNATGGGVTVELKGRVYRNNSATNWYQVETTDNRTGQKTSAYVCNTTFDGATTVNDTAAQPEAEATQVAAADTSATTTPVATTPATSNTAVSNKANTTNTTSAASTTTVARRYRKSRKTVSEVNRTYKVTGTKKYLPVRTTAAYKTRNIIDKLYNDDEFTAESFTRNGYAYGHTADNVYGYVDARYLV